MGTVMHRTSAPTTDPLLAGGRAGSATPSDRRPPYPDPCAAGKPPRRPRDGGAALLGHLIAFLVFSLAYALIRVVAGHPPPIVASVVLAVPCELGGVVAGRALRRWMQG